MIEHRVPQGVPSMPVQRYIRRAWPLLPEGRLRSAFQRRDVKIGGVRASREDMLHAGDEITIYMPAALFSGELKVLFDDGALLVVEKPVGLPVDRDKDGIGEDTLLTRAQRIYPQARLCHRLDTDTGGVMALALTPDMHAALLAAFSAGAVEKVYRAIVLGAPEDAASLTGYLKKDAETGMARVYAHPLPGALTVLTDYRVLARGALNYIEVDLKTGRTHQIRAHLAAENCPLLGDDKYGDRAQNKRYKVSKPCLWCVRLTIKAGGVLARYADTPFESPDPYRKDFEA